MLKKLRLNSPAKIILALLFVIAFMASPLSVSKVSGYSYNIYFGDLHVHTSARHNPDEFEKEFSREKIKEANRYARDIKNHDFIAIINHDTLLKNWMWRVEKEVADEFTQDDVFISFPAYEWTASKYCGRHTNPPMPDYPQWGHRNVYYRNSQEAPLLRCNDPRYDSPAELFSNLPKPNLTITIPHHPGADVHPFDWSIFNEKYDRLVEIIQNRGSYEKNLIRNGWNKGLFFGVVGGTDNHGGKAGGHQGITAILAPRLTRDDLFNALRARHAYATTHGDIILHFFGDEQIQGSILSPRNKVQLKAEVEGKGSNLSLVEFIDNGKIVDSWSLDQPTFQFEKTKTTNGKRHYYYLRLTLKNGHQAWSSPILVEG